MKQPISGKMITVVLSLLAWLWAAAWGCKNARSELALSTYRPSKNVKNLIAKAVKATDTLQLTVLFEEAQKQARNDSDRVVIIEGYDQIGVNFRNKSKYDQALEYHEKALQNARSLGNKLILCAVLNNIGVVYRRMGENSLALDHHMEALQIAETFSDARNICISMNSIGNIHLALNNFKEGLSYFKQTIDLERIRNNPLGIAINLNNIGAAFEGLWQLDSALYYYTASLQQNKAIGQKTGEAICYNAIAGVYTQEGKYKESLNYLDQAIQLNIEIGDRIYLAESYAKKAAVYVKLKNWLDAKSYYQKSLDIAREIGSKWEEYIALEGLSEIYRNRGDFKNALLSFQQSQTIKDAVNNEKNLKHLLTIQNKYASFKQQQQIDILQKQKANSNFQLAILGVGLLLFGIVFYAYYRNSLQKNKIMNQMMQLQEQQIRKLETEQKLTATEAILKGEEQERTRLARDLHDGLGGMLSGIKYTFDNIRAQSHGTSPDQSQAFDRGMDMLDSSIREMRRVAHNMMPEALVKFGLDTALKDFCNDINQSGALEVKYQSIGLDNVEIDQSTSIIVYRIVQELIHNTMRHAHAKSAIVQLSKSEEELSVTVEDDGRGFDIAILEYSKGIGWANIQTRVDYLKGKLDIWSEPGKGTSVHVEINIEGEI
jgi:signal transduction histidine kinase